MGDMRVQILAYADAIWRRRWYATVIAWLVCVVGWVVVIMMPSQFQSEARIYVDTDGVLGPLLKGIAITADIDRQVAIMQKTLLSRPNLERVALMTDLDITATTSAQMDSLLGRLAANTTIRGQGKSLFTLSHTDQDPVLAKEVVRSLVTIFVEEVLGQNRTEKADAVSFIQEQLDGYEKQLRAAEGRLADFKRRHMEILPGGGKNFASRLRGASGKRDAARLAYEDAVVRRDQLRKQLGGVARYREIETIRPGAAGGPASVFLPRIQGLERRLDDLRLRFTDQHPDVVATMRTLETLRAQYEEEQTGRAAGDFGATTTTRTREPNPLYDEIKLKLVDLEADVVSLRRRLAQAAAQVVDLDLLALRAPKVEAELADLNRDYEILKGNYEGLLSRRESARLAQAVETKSDNIQFKLVDPPRVPTKPVAPNRPLFMSVVLIMGLGAGVGFAFLLAQLDDSFRTPESLKQSFGLPVLGCVSLIVSAGQRTRRIADGVGFGAVSLSLMGVYGGLLVLLPYLAQMQQFVAGLSLPEFVRGFI